MKLIFPQIVMQRWLMTNMHYASQKDMSGTSCKADAPSSDSFSATVDTLPCPA